jgi:hypothetical protein
LRKKTELITPALIGIILAGMVLIGIPKQDLCDIQIGGKIMGTKGCAFDVF